MATYDLGKVTGDDGVGITNIAKTGTSGLVDTYTITLSNGSTKTFTVTNGAKGDTGSTGATGKGISSISKTGTSGLVDTYTITYSDNTTSTFTVTNGANGSDASVTIVDNLTSDSSTSVLSAKQGKVLNTNKIETSAIANNLTTTSSGYVLDARQGKALADLIGSAITYINQ